MNKKRMELAYKRFRLMCKLDPDTMAAIMAWNNMAMEYDIPENSKLQKRYKELVELVKKYG